MTGGKSDILIIAIDGPAASGKGTIGRRLARHLGLRHLDTGLSYRAVAHALLQQEAPLDESGLAAQMAQQIDLGALDRELLSAHEIGEAASRVAVLPALRQALVKAQRSFAAVSPGCVVDGRDIGTVVFPDADLKLYVTASPEARAMRRYLEILDRGGTADADQILADIRRRDARDFQRADSPLAPATDAHLIDTTTMDIETAFRSVLALVEKLDLAKRE